MLLIFNMYWVKYGLYNTFYCLIMQKEGLRLSMLCFPFANILAHILQHLLFMFYKHFISYGI